MSQAEKYAELTGDAKAVMDIALEHFRSVMPSGPSMSPEDFRNSIFTLIDVGAVQIVADDEGISLRLTKEAIG